MLDESSSELEASLGELRELARGIHPAELSDRGLRPALETLATRAPLPVDVSGDTDDLPPALATAVYFVVSEALTNVAKYAGAANAAVTVERDAERVTVTIADDGVGGADPDAGSGLRGLLDRVASLDGELRLHSPPGGGTRVEAAFPLNGRALGGAQPAVAALSTLCSRSPARSPHRVEPPRQEADHDENRCDLRTARLPCSRHPAGLRRQLDLRTAGESATWPPRPMARSSGWTAGGPRARYVPACVTLAFCVARVRTASSEGCFLFYELGFANKRGPAVKVTRSWKPWCASPRGAGSLKRASPSGSARARTAAIYGEVEGVSCTAARRASGRPIWGLMLCAAWLRSWPRCGVLYEVRRGPGGPLVIATYAPWCAEVPQWA